MAPDLAQFRHVLSVLTVPAYFFLAFTFYRRNLWRSYFFFWVCLFAEGVTQAGLLAAGDAPWAMTLYKISQPPMWLLYIAMVIEVFQKVFVQFPGVARFAKRAVIASMVVAFVIALFSIDGAVTAEWSGRSLIFRYSVILRTISTALSAFLIFIAAFLVWMPIPLPPNTIRHSLLFFFYFLLTTNVYYLLNSRVAAAAISADFVQWANLVIVISNLAALLAWYYLLKPSGEAFPPTGPAPRAGSAEMLARLESINKALSRERE